MKESEGIMPMTSTYSGVVLQQKVKGFFFTLVWLCISFISGIIILII